MNNDAPADERLDKVATQLISRGLHVRIPLDSPLSPAIQGKGAFRRFKDELHEERPGLLQAWYAFRDTRAERRAVEWLADNSLIDDEAAEHFMNSHPDPDLP